MMLIASRTSRSVMVMMKVAGAAFLVALLGSMSPALCAELSGSSRPPVTWRTHMTLNDARGIAYVLSEVHNVADAGDTQLLLVLDRSTGQRFIMTRRYDIENHRSVMQIGDVAGKKYVRLWYALPSAAKNRSELVAELRANPSLFDVADPVVTLETPGFSFTANASDFKKTGPHGRWLSDLRESLDPAFLEGLERMRAALFASEPGSTFYLTLGKYLFHGDCEPSGGNATIAFESPDCDFDKSFGSPCSDRQLELIAKAKDGSRVLTKY